MTSPAGSLGRAQVVLPAFTINAGTMVAGQTYIVQANYFQIEDIDTTSFTGTGITGDSIGLSEYLMSTFITIDVIPEPSPTSMLLIAGGAAWLLMSISKLRRKGCR